ncbi:hypothetical protein LJ739_06500 [Aestuariibacter halophilus]|uniref:DUF4142 domain-containing protein n=1 Tax=Fluctibacter halophilus TaxID=226011 RepID=A0ABS8G7V3_9ALTE|nr:hypothetical protein [Aestuariibacter halophilus]MCC2615885.1 hypothetical protein [Aestuariibacter halophilus]
MTQNGRILVVCAILGATGLAGWLHDQKPAEEQEQTPAAAAISYVDILDNPEFEQRMLAAVMQQDTQAISALQDKALEIARAAGLDQTQIDLLSGEQGREFMQFRARRQHFLAAFEERYYNLQDLGSLAEQFPEAADLIARAEQLIEQRDNDIRHIAETLAQGEPIQPYLEQARSQWLARANEQQPQG